MMSNRLLNLLTGTLLGIGLLFAVQQYGTGLKSAFLDIAEAPEAKPTFVMPEMSEAQQGQTFYCTGDRVRPRTSPTFADTSVIPDLRLMKGDTVRLLAKSVKKYSNNGKTGSWHFVELPNGLQTWVFYYLELQPVLPEPVRLPLAHHIGMQEAGIRKIISDAATLWSTSFGNENEKSLAQLVKSCDFYHEKVRNTAVQEAVKNKADGSFNIGQVCNLYEFAVKDWKYANDPGAYEYVAKASESLENRQKGDCDDFAVLVFSLVEAVGGDCRINYACGGGGCHAFTEVNIGDGNNLESVKEYISIRFRCDKESLTGFRRDAASGDWFMNLDWFDKFVGGQYFNYSRGVRFDINKRDFQRL
jgi:hypothetical protein